MSRRLLISTIVIIIVIWLKGGELKEDRDPFIIAHRGSSGTHPEESQVAYTKAIAVGTDYLECDLQTTRDKVLLCSHDPNLSFITTNIEQPEHRRLFPESDRHEEIIDDTSIAAPTRRNGWFIPDYDWDSVRTLRLVQSYVERSNQYDKKYPLFTFDELIDLCIQSGKGIYLESKDSTWYQNTRNINLPKLIIMNLCRRGFCKIYLNDSKYFSVKSVEKFPCPIYLQTFCFDDLVFWDTVGVSNFIPMAALVYNGNSISSPYGVMHFRVPESPNNGRKPNVKLDVRPAVLKDLKFRNVSALAPSKQIILSRQETVKEVHDIGLDVHVWTFRNEPAAIIIENENGTFKREYVHQNIDRIFDGDVYKELKFFHDLKVDGFFTDFPGTVRNFIEFSRNVHKINDEEFISQYVTH